MGEHDLEGTVYTLVAQAASARGVTISLGPEVSLRRDLGLDSLALATLLFHFGEAVGVDPNDLLESMADRPVSTLADLVAIGRRVLGGAPEGSHA